MGLAWYCCILTRQPRPTGQQWSGSLALGQATMGGKQVLYSGRRWVPDLDEAVTVGAMGRPFPNWP